MSNVPSRFFDLSGPIGAAPGYFVLRAYDEGAFGRRYTFSNGGPETGNLLIPWPAVPMFEAFMGGRAQSFSSAQVDLTQAASGLPIVPALPGYFFMPVDDGALRIFSMAGAGTLTHPPTIKLRQNTTELGTGPVKVDAFVGAADYVMRPAVDIRVLATDVVDVGTSPIVLDVLDPATGTGGFAWTAIFVLSGTWMVSDSGGFAPAT